MEVIDKTPAPDDKVRVDFLQRFRGTGENGSTRQAELEAQNAVIAQLDLVLDARFSLIRNIRLKDSWVLEPLVLIGPPGVFVIHTPPFRESPEAGGGRRKTSKNARRDPASINLASRLSRLAQALQAWLKRQGPSISPTVEPVLIASNSAMRMEAPGHAVRVVMNNAVTEFASSLLQSRTVLEPMLVFELVDRILNPRSIPAIRSLEPAGIWTEVQTKDASEAPSRARAIFDAARQTKSFDPNDVSFAFAEDPGPGPEHGLLQTIPSHPIQPATPTHALTFGQGSVLAVMVLIEVSILAALVYLLLISGR